MSGFDGGGFENTGFDAGGFGSGDAGGFGSGGFGNSPAGFEAAFPMSGPPAPVQGELGGFDDPSTMSTSGGHFTSNEQSSAREFGGPTDGGHSRSHESTEKSRLRQHSSDGPTTDLDEEAHTSITQLASVIDAAAKIEGASGAGLQRLGRELVSGRRELERQFRRRRDFERQLEESRAQLDELREEKRKLEQACATIHRDTSHLQDELGFMRRQIEEAEQDLAVLRESGGPTADASRRKAYSSTEDARGDVLSRVRQERERLEKDQREIAQLRAQMEEIQRRKFEAQAKQQVLLEKQRQAEQDRGLMLTALEADRGKLSTLRGERIKLWEERCRIDRETTDIAQEEWLAQRYGPQSASTTQPRGSVPATGPAAISNGDNLKGVRRGASPPAVRGPSSYADDRELQEHGGDALNRGPGWTSFGGSGGVGGYPGGVRRDPPTPSFG